MIKRRRILIFADYYLPSVGAGGGVRLLANLVEQFADRYDFFVVARDHDSRTDRRQFTEVPLNEWTTHGPAETYYFTRNRLTARVTERIVEYSRPDLVFLNSLFSIASVRFLWERWKGKYLGLPVVVSPCGEVLTEGLKQKRLKKMSYLNVVKRTRFHEGLIWRATSDTERQDIVRAIGGNPKVFVAPDLVPSKIVSGLPTHSKPPKPSGTLRIAYVARIVKNKNLKYLLEVLTSIDSGNVMLDIIGPPENTAYWRECSEVIARFPSNVEVRVAGLLPHEEVIARLQECHIFVLPTETENFGYAIVEALANGCPIVISDRTHWNYLENEDFAFILPLAQVTGWIKVIQKFLDMSDDEYLRLSSLAREFASDWLSASGSEAKMEEIFKYAMDQSRTIAVG